VLVKKPERKTKCKACGEFIYVQRAPDDTHKRLMTQAQADKAEAEWSRRGDEAMARRIIVEAGLGVDEYENALSRSPAQPMAVARGLLTDRALAGDRDAVLGMMRIASNDEERERWHLLLVEIDLAKLARQGIRSAQLSAGMARDRLCPTCRKLDQSVISVNAGARAVIPLKCTCSSKGLLTVSGWIKRPDGSGYMDRG